jgi:hypothetical protein
VGSIPCAKTVRDISLLNIDMNQELHENRKVSIRTVEEFERFKDSTKETPSDLFVGTIPTFNPLNELPPEPNSIP